MFLEAAKITDSSIRKGMRANRVASTYSWIQCHLSRTIQMLPITPRPWSKDWTALTYWNIIDRPPAIVNSSRPSKLKYIVLPTMMATFASSYSAESGPARLLCLIDM